MLLFWATTLQTLVAWGSAQSDFFTRWAGPTLDPGQAARLLADLKAAAANDPGPQQHVPVLIVPPLTGVQLEVLLDKPSRSPHFWCTAHSDWKTLWISTEILFPGQFSCIAENLRSVLDLNTNRSQSLPGVTIRAAHGFESLTPLANLNVLNVIQRTLEQQGWLAKEIKTHIYDWRLVPSDWAAAGQAWTDLQRDIEQLSIANDGRPVAVVGISMGAPYASAFFSSGVVDDAWKARHVAALFSVSGVFGGAPVATWDTISARLEGFEHLFPRSDVSQLMRAFPALSWLAPAAEVYGDTAPIVINTALNTNYSAAELGTALQQTGAQQAAAYWHITRRYSPTKAPGVPVFCMVSRGLPTPARITYKSTYFSDAPEVQYGDGDLTVPTAGLTTACLQWATQPGHPRVSIKTWWEVPHAGILMTTDGMTYFLQQLKGLSVGSRAGSVTSVA